ncbi:MAG: response regulator transcription factor, partial [Bacteroidota bacterium]
MPIRVAIFDDNKKIRHSLEILISGSPGLEVTGTFDDALDVENKISKSSPDIVLMDIEMPGVTGIEAVKKIRKKFPNLTVIMQTVFDDDEKIFQSIINGASGYILKNASPVFLLQALEEAYHGGAPMSPSIAKKVLMIMQQQQEVKKPADDFNLTER